MNYQVDTTHQFDRRVKRLAKKYPSIIDEIENLIKLLSKDPNQGIPVEKNCYKIRMAIASKGQGKSGGARILYYVKTKDHRVFLIEIFDKSESENISDRQLQELLKQII